MIVVCCGSDGAGPQLPSTPKAPRIRTSRTAFLIRFGKHGKLGRLFSAEDAGSVYRFVSAHGKHPDGGFCFILDLCFAVGASTPAALDESSLLLDQGLEALVVSRLMGVFLAEGQSPV